MIKQSKIASLLLAGLLHIAPSTARLAQRLPNLASPIAIVMGWFVRAAAVAGAYHTLSAASAVLASPTSVSGTQGTRLSYQIRINDGENRTPESWMVDGQLFGKAGSTTRGMPPGLSLSLGTGIISGTPTAGGSFPTTITAYEGANGTQTALTFTITFNITGTIIPTAIIAHPVAAALHVGEPFNLGVTAVGSPPLTYQWQKDQANIEGATEATYSPGVAQLSSAGSYRVIVSGPGGAATSNPATVSATPLSIQLVGKPTDSASFVLQTIPGRSYILQGTASLNPAAWVPAGTATAASSTTTISETLPTGTARFWRYSPQP